MDSIKQEFGKSQWEQETELEKKAENEKIEGFLTKSLEEKFRNYIFSLKPEEQRLQTIIMFNIFKRILQELPKAHDSIKST